ncbi:MAG: winged helix-turn-helix domain-containing protein [Actinomycetales bacterium]|nr:winged helix-turn-helix domain-containing protein [Actinomycetales bacterium]
MIELTRQDARRAALWSAGLLSSLPTPGEAQRASARRQAEHVRDLLGRLGAVQLDTISVLARSHELIAYARQGAVRRSAIEDAYWAGDAAFEYWSHAACILPMSSWPDFAFRRREFRAKGERWHGAPRHDLDVLLGTIRDRGPITTADVGGAKTGGEWWDWSDAKIGLEWLLDIGMVVVTRRVGWRRTYDLAERAIPSALLHDDLTDEQCHARLVAAGARLMGVGTAGDIADVHRLPRASVSRHAEEAGLVPVAVEGWPRAWAHPEALAWLAGAGRDRHRTTLLSPFDPLVWYRERAERIFGMRHRIEAYTPAHKRVHGYFAMPVLHQGRLVARVDPKREGDTLVARRVTLESTSASAVDGTARALLEAARWVGSSSVALRDVVPEAARPALAKRLAG